MSDALWKRGWQASDEPDESHDDEQGHQNRPRPQQIAKEAGHLDATVFRNGFHHQVWRVTDVAVGPHEHRTR